MENIINKAQKLGEIVSIFPGASEIFNKYKIDFCCGGHDTLEEALQEKTYNSEGILQELNHEYQQFIKSNSEYRDWRVEKPSILIRHILQTHHEYTKRELNEISPLLFKILKVHYKHHSEELVKVHKYFGALKTELEQHLVKEEELLFPLIESYEKTTQDSILSQIHQVIKDTEAEHDAAGDILKALEKVTRDFCAPEDACTTFKLVYAKLHGLEKDLFTHIYLENSVLFHML